MITPKGFELAGQFSVDAGQVLIADPCYLIRPAEDKSGPLVPTDWESWHEMMVNEGYFESHHLQVKHHWVPDDPRYLEVGVVVSTGEGDGVYPVFVRYKEGPIFGGPRVQEVRIIFF